MALRTVLYDGWPAVCLPNSPADIHLEALLAYHPASLPGVLALPFPPDGVRAAPAWLPDHITPHFLPVANTASGRIAWEQRTLPGLARRLGAGLLHITTVGPPLFASTPVLVSPAGFSRDWLDDQPRQSHRPGERAGFAARLREAFAEGGLSRARGVFWPEDLPAPRLSLPLLRLPPVVPPAFLHPSGGPQGGNGARPWDEEILDLPESYILYHGPHTAIALRRLMGVWSWAAGPVGEVHPLLLAGLDQLARLTLEELKVEYGLQSTVRALPAPLSMEVLAALYRGCKALLHPAPVSPWGGPLRLALASGAPVVSLENALSDALVGPAAYLVKVGESEQTSRALGAALITVVVEEEVSIALAQAAQQRAAGWNVDAFSARLLAAYQSILSPSGR